MIRARDHVESVHLIPHTGRHDREMLRAFVASLRDARRDIEADARERVAAAMARLA